MTEPSSSIHVRTGPPTCAVSALASALLSGGGIVGALAMGLAAALVFGLAPGLDLASAGLFYAGEARFVGQAPWGEALRRVFVWLPFGIYGLMVALALARRMTGAMRWGPCGRGIVFLTLSLVLGPGLLVNTVLKDHSHRPRPVQVVQFGGTLPFRPFYRLDGECKRNCSFVSGEGSTGFWTLAPALLVPARLQPMALAAALVFAVLTSLLRMAFGGHFLSDTVFSALFTWLVIVATWRALFGGGPAGSASDPSQARGYGADKPIVNHDAR